MNNRTRVPLQELTQGSDPKQALLEETRGLVRKWEPTGLLEGLNEEPEVHGMAVLLENQAQELVKEASQTSTSENSEEWAGVALPLVRRVFGEIAAKELVSVQPMNLPSGLVFYLDFKYGTSGQPGFTQGDSVYGTTDTEEDPDGGFYGAGRFAFSENDESAAFSYGSGNSLSTTEGTHEWISGSSVTWKDVDFDQDLSASLSDLGKVTVRFWDSDNIDTEGVRAFAPSSSDGGGDGFNVHFPAHTEITGVDTDSDGSVEAYDVTFIVGRQDSNGDLTNSAGLTSSSDSVTTEYYEQPVSYDRGDFEDRSSSSHVGASGYQPLDIPEIDVSLRSEPIVAKTRKLKAVWTPELAQDFNAYHSVDAEAELTSMLSEYISMEIDLEILDMLIQNALTVDRWSALPGYEYDSAAGTFVDEGSHTGTKNEWFQTLGNKIQRVSNKIHQKTMRGGANFLVCSPDVATIIESIPGFAADTDGDQMQFAMGVQRVGQLNNRFTVYKNPYMLENQMLVGYRGNNFLETGAVYAPYIPLIMTPLIYDPNNFTPRRGVMTRYAKKMVRPEFYGLIQVGHVDRV